MPSPARSRNRRGCGGRFGTFFRVPLISRLKTNQNALTRPELIQPPPEDLKTPHSPSRLLQTPYHTRYPSEELPDLISMCCKAIQEHEGWRKQDLVASWDAEAAKFTSKSARAPRTQRTSAKRRKQIQNNQSNCKTPRTLPKSPVITRAYRGDSVSGRWAAELRLEG